MESCIDILGDAAIFSRIDCTSGYWQISVARKDREKTTFTTVWGTYRYLRMPFRLRNFHATFQRALDTILRGVRLQVCLDYLDYLVIDFSRDTEDHNRHLDMVLLLLRDAGITLKFRKCFFFQLRLEHFVHVISPGKLAVSDSHINAFQNFEIASSLRELRSFLGACKVNKMCIKMFAPIVRPLNHLSRKDADPG